MKKFLWFIPGLLSGLLLCSCASKHTLSREETALIRAVRLPVTPDAILQKRIGDVKDVNFFDASGMTPLEYAIRRQNEKKIKALLDHGADPLFKDGHGYTALHLASALKDTSALKLILNKCQNVEIRAEDGRTPLMEAARNGNLDAMRIFIEKGADVNAVDHQGRAPLTFAAMAKYNSKNAVILLLENKAEKLTDEPKALPLLVSIDYNNTDTAEYLLDLLPDFDQKQITDLAGFVSMKHAVFMGNIQLVKKIIAKKLPLNSPLGVIYRGMDFADMEGIYQALADLGVVDDGRTPVFWAAEAEQPEIARLLVENGAVLDVCDHNGNRPDQYARKRETVETFKDLKKNQ